MGLFEGLHSIYTQKAYLNELAEREDRIAAVVEHFAYFIDGGKIYRCDLRFGTVYEKRSCNWYSFYNIRI